ncbi:MAG: lipopolysaccharide transport periplasmic protein LptA [Burkholderiales bacterium]|nr:lipopolysaccharide transport periplasmic protein LptA [Burkholderiales bacterium]
MRRIAAAALAALLLTPLAAAAEKADRDKPLLIEADRMSADDVRKVATFEGEVVLTKGTIRMTAERIVVTEGEKGFHQATATGNPVRFRQRLDPKDGKEAVWVDGEALRAEYDERTERIELFENARVTRDRDEVRGDYILYDQRTEFFSVRAGKETTSGRVRAIIQPKSASEPPAGGAPPAR